MLISALYTSLSSPASSKKLGEVWKPRANGYMVGRDVNSLTQTSPVLSPNRNLVLAKGEDTKFTSSHIFADARSFAAGGGRVKNFRTVNLGNPDKSSAAAPEWLYEKNGYCAGYSGGDLRVFSKDDKGNLELVASHRVTDDTRLSWDADGKPVFHTGARACSSDGALAAEGADNILVRLSGRDVQAGNGTTVLNLSDQKGVFSGGNGVSYLGSYGQGFVIKGGYGRTEYAGYFNGATLAEAKGAGDFSGVFENLTIEAADSANRFSGYFRDAAVNGGKNADVFSGMFLSGTILNGGKGDDNFSGRFIGSLLDGGEGDDVFGRGVALNTKATVFTESGDKYLGLESDFVDSTVSAGEGNDSFSAPMWGGSLDLGEGDDESRGLFSNAIVHAGEGNDRLAALYADASVFESGAGDNSVELATARGSSVSTGEGANKIVLGRNTGTLEQNSGVTVGGDPVMGTTTFSSPEEYATGKAGIRFGELSGNLVHAEQGENIISVYNGSGRQSVLTGWDKDGTDDKKREVDETRAATQGGQKAPAASATDAVKKEAESVPAQRPAAMISNLLPEAGGDRAGASSGSSGEDDRSEANTPAQTRRALERYALLLGESPQRKGGTGATVMTGAGENLELGVEYRPRHVIDGNPATIRQYRRRYNGYGSTVLGTRYFG